MENPVNISPRIEVIRCDRRSVSLRLTDDLRIVIRAPLAMPQTQIRAFLEHNRTWIDRRAREITAYNRYMEQLDPAKLNALAKQLLPAKTAYYASILGVTPAYVHITSAKKRFGSCNEKNGICFSYYLMSYPEKAIDYVVVHELCHILHHDHSQAFYNCVRDVLPDFRERQQLLRTKLDD